MRNNSFLQKLFSLLEMDRLWIPILAILMSLIFFSPFAPLSKLSTSIAYGDAVQFSFFLAWGHDTIKDLNFREFWNMPISHPLDKAGGLTDILPGLALQTFWLRLFTDNPILIFNLLTLLCGILNVACFCITARKLGLGRISTALASIVFAFNAKIIWHAAGHLSVIAMWWIPLVFLFYFKFLMNRNLLFSLALSFSFFMLTFTSTRLGLIGAFGLITLHLITTIYSKDKVLLKQSGFLLLALAISLIPIYLIYSPATEITRVLPDRRGTVDVVFGSSDFAGFFIPSQESFRDRTISGAIASRLHPRASRGEDTVYFGWLTYIVITTGILMLFRRKWNLESLEDIQITKFATPLLLSAIILLILSLGPYFWFLGKLTSIPMPWMVVIEFFPALTVFRVPSRLAIIAGFFLALFFGLIIELIFRKYSLTKIKRIGFFTVLLIIFIIDFRPYSPIQRFTPDLQNPFYSFIQENHTEIGAIVHLPFPGTQLWLLDHRGFYPATVNSFQGGLRNRYEMEVTKILQFPTSPEAMELYDTIGVTHLFARNSVEAALLRESELFIEIEPNIFRVPNVRVEKAQVARNSPLPFDFSGFVNPVYGFNIPDGEIILHWIHSVSEMDSVQLRQMTIGEVKSDSILLHSDGVDSSITFHFEEHLDVSGIHGIQVDVKFVKTIQDRIEMAIYWTPEGGSPSESTKAEITIIPSGEWQSAIFDLSSHREFRQTSKIERIRIDFENPSLPTSVYELGNIYWLAEMP